MFDDAHETFFFFFPFSRPSPKKKLGAWSLEKWEYDLYNLMTTTTLPWQFSILDKTFQFFLKPFSHQITHATATYYYLPYLVTTTHYLVTTTTSLLPPPYYYYYLVTEY